MSEISISLTPTNLTTNPAGPDPLYTPSGACKLNQSTTITSLSFLSPSHPLSSTSYTGLLLDGEICDNLLMPRTFWYSPEMHAEETGGGGETNPTPRAGGGGKKG